MLCAQADEQGYRRARQLTYRQAQQAGGQMRKSEKSATLVKHGNFEQKGGEIEKEKTIGYAKAYCFVSGDQLDRLREGLHCQPIKSSRDLCTETDPDEAVFAFI